MLNAFFLLWFYKVTYGALMAVTAHQRLWPSNANLSRVVMLVINKVAFYIFTLSSDIKCPCQQLLSRSKRTLPHTAAHKRCIINDRGVFVSPFNKLKVTWIQGLYLDFCIIIL